MSGPKGFEITLAERARVARETEAARARCRALLERRDKAATALSMLGVGHDPLATHVVGSLDLPRAVAVEQSLADEAARLEGALRDERVRAVRAHLALALEQRQQPSSPPARDAAYGGVEKRAVAEAPQSAQARAERMRGRLTRTLDAIAEIDAAPRAELLLRADAVTTALATADVAQVELLMLSLQTETERSLRAQRERDLVRRQAADLVVRTAWMIGPEADALRGRALACATASEFSRVRVAEETLTAAAHAADDRAYVIEHTRRALAALGYEVGEEFTEVALGGEPVVATRPDLRGYGLQWRFGPADQVFTNVVALGSVSDSGTGAATRGAEVEHATCGHIEAVRHAWQEEGIGATLRHHRAPGDVPIEAVPSSSAQRIRAAQRRAAHGSQARAMGQQGEVP
jgi:hypothetical protein